jgi:hypothetical protein
MTKRIPLDATASLRPLTFERPRRTNIERGLETCVQKLGYTDVQEKEELFLRPIRFLARARYCLGWRTEKPTGKSRICSGSVRKPYTTTWSVFLPSSRLETVPVR